MSISSSFFCEYCGAANEIEARDCCFCGRPLDKVEVEATILPSFTGLHTLPVDTLLKGRYRITKAVGQGGMGTVYQAQDTALNNRAVAIKELIVNNPDVQASQEAIEAFKREATLLASLQHANLPSVFEHFTENERWYMTMTFIQGKTLEEHLAHNSRKKLPLHEVLEIGKQLSSVLYYLHNQYPPIIFRDIKPANIMRAPDGRIYLIDFGVARRFKTGQKKDTIPFGSLGYAAPEQFGKAQTTPRSDIYSLGATIYELLTGHEPANTPLQFPSLRTLAPSLPFKLVTLINEMLEQDESKRPANMLIVEQRLQEIASTPWQTTPSPGFSSMSAPSTRPSWRLAGVLGTLLAIFCLLVGGFIGDGVGTSNATANYQTQANATATAQTNATATAQANALATAVTAAMPDPYQPKGTLALFDPLNQENQWKENTDTNFGGSCTFKNNALQASQTKADRFFYCDEENGAAFQNFAIEVKMTIMQGDCGGLVLRENTSYNGQLYLFDVCNDTAYDFYSYQSNTASKSLASGFASAINISTMRPTENTIAIVANHNVFDLYANQRKIASVTDSSYHTGAIGLVANCSASPTTVSYQDIKIWKLP